ncbi:uncharacterized protein LOC141525814 isoform X2 [Cotesia typhae]|uniref:uncharacterized protein LOC141525814 isoform X2 n=1 Tax=Cotesia typhae TaxID=2053667 RepID=UPI003D693667
MDIDLHPESETLVSLFKKWNVPEDVINNFIGSICKNYIYLVNFLKHDRGITINLMYELSAENLKELCPHLGTRLI